MVYDWVKVIIIGLLVGFILLFKIIAVIILRVVQGVYYLISKI